MSGETLGENGNDPVSMHAVIHIHLPMFAPESKKPEALIMFVFNTCQVELFHIVVSSTRVESWSVVNKVMWWGMGRLTVITDFSMNVQNSILR